MPREGKQIDKFKNWNGKAEIDELVNQLKREGAKQLDEPFGDRETGKEGIR